jgi:hypothetical protein
MSFLTISEIADSTVMRSRVTACAARERIPQPEDWAWAQRWAWAAAPGWAEAVESWRAANSGDGWAAHPAVISDGMILTQVQAMNPARRDDDCEAPA